MVSVRINLERLNGLDDWTFRTFDRLNDWNDWNALNGSPFER